MSDSDYLVKEITVDGSFKSWGDGQARFAGQSSGTGIVLTVIPRDPAQRGWTAAEAQVVGLDVRLKIHVALMADAQLRGVALPAEAAHAVNRYREEIQRLRVQVGERADWQDADLASPNPPLVSGPTDISEMGG